MSFLSVLQSRLPDSSHPFMISKQGSLSLQDILAAPSTDFSSLCPGDVVALVGAFDPLSIATLLRLLDMGMIVVPLTKHTASQHAAFFEAAHVNICIQDGCIHKVRSTQSNHILLQKLRGKGDSGLILFTSGTTGQPKAILHSGSHFLARYTTKRKPMRTSAFLLFDHIGGLNTLFHMLFNGGEVIVPQSLALENILESLEEHAIELFPTTPTFLRLLLLSGMLNAQKLSALRCITYGTEPMDQPTLNALCEALPFVDFRQTYGMSELGILRIKSRSRNSLWMQVGGEGVQTKIQDDLLYIRAEHGMLGYLNAPSPFDEEGWYCTQDMVESDGEWLRITGRKNELINVGGLKIMPGEVEKAALQYPGIVLAKAYGAQNPITGMHVELRCQTTKDLPQSAEKKEATRALQHYLREKLPAHAVPQRIYWEAVPINHRYKKR